MSNNKCASSKAIAKFARMCRDEVINCTPVFTYWEDGRKANLSRLMPYAGRIPKDSMDMLINSLPLPSGSPSDYTDITDDLIAAIKAQQ